MARRRTTISGALSSWLGRFGGGRERPGGWWVRGSRLVPRDSRAGLVVGLITGELQKTSFGEEPPIYYVSYPVLLEVALINMLNMHVITEV